MNNDKFQGKYQTKQTGKFGDVAHLDPSTPKIPACVMPWLVKFVTYWSQPDIEQIFLSQIVFEVMALVNNLDKINSNLHQIESINNRYTRKEEKKPKVENSEHTRISVAE